MSKHELTGNWSGELFPDERREFAAFVEARPILPRPTTDAAVFRLVRERSLFDLQDFFLRFLPVQALSGLATLAVCPQFGIGGQLGGRLEPWLHIFEHPLLFYLTCGLFFVGFGALLSGLLIGQNPRAAFSLRAYRLFAAYSLGAFLLLRILGSETFVLVSLVWLVGAMAGNILGFRLGGWLRQTLGQRPPVIAQG